MSRMISGFDALPDSLLAEILCRLPIKDAVRSSLVSRRWKNLWAYMPALDFDFADFWSENIFTHGRYSTYVSEISECHDNFVRIIDGVLASRRAQRLERFKLVWEYQVRYYPDTDQHHPVRRWILLILQQRPRVLSIYVQPDEVLNVPTNVFVCSSLEEMKLQVNNRWPVVLKPKLVNLSHLRKLNLGFFTIDDDFMDKILLGCPNLEELELYACRLKLSHITGGNLRSLVLDGCCNSTEIRVSIPTLQYLKVTIMSCQVASIILANMSSLVKACVCFLTADEFPKTFCNSKANILNGLSGVTNLEFVLHGSESERMFEHALVNCPNFKNLKALYLESFDGSLLDCMGMIYCLMLHSPLLEDLTFHCCEDEYFENVLLEDLKDLALEMGSCQLVDRREGHVYDSLDKLQKQVIQYMMRFEKMEREIVSEHNEEEGDEDEEEEENVEEEEDDDDDDENEEEEEDAEEDDDEDEEEEEDVEEEDDDEEEEEDGGDR